MHEMAIAQSVLDIASGEMEKHAASRINKVKLSIGEFSGVVREALEFAFDVLKPGTAAGDADFEIEIVPMRADCASCGPVACRLSDLSLLCPQCGNPATIVGGREMTVDYVDLD